MSNTSFLKFSFLLVCILVLNSCNSSVSKKTYTICFSQCVGSDLWRQTMLAEMKMELSLQPEANFIYADADNDSERQVAQVEEMLKEEPDLLIISPNQARPLTEIVERVYKKGIPVVIIDRKTSTTLYTAYVGASNYEVGALAGKYLNNLYKDTPAQVIEIMGLAGSSPAVERAKGFKEAIKYSRKIDVLTVHGDWLAVNAKRELLRIKDQLAEVDAVFAHNDAMAAAARTVLDSLGLSENIKVIGVDALPGKAGGLEMVANGAISASMVYPTGGREAISTAFNILQNQPFVKENILPSFVVDDENVELMKMQWSKISNQQSDIERQRELLKEQRDIYKSQQVVLNVISIAFFIAVSSGGLAFYFLRENRKINKSLEAKNKEIIIERNHKLNFFAHISHEFRTPLTLMVSPTEDLLNNPKLPVADQKNVKLIYQNIHRLLKLVGQLIDYRKIEYDSRYIKASEHDVVNFVKHIKGHFDEQAERLNIDIQLYSAEESIMLWFDPNLLDKVFFNLIANALKFVNDGGVVEISIHKSERSVAVEVKDNGIGISEEDIPHVFEQFYQAGEQYHQGSGIGLSLAKEIVNLHHGNITVESRRSRYTKFVVSIPLGAQHLTNLEKKVGGLISPDHIKEVSKMYTSAFVHTEPQALLHTKDQSILIVEDNRELLQYLSDKFEAYFNVFTALDGNEALTSAFANVPDLILSDLVVPGINGKELSEKIKSDLRTSHIPVVLLTAQGSVGQQISGIESGADLYITKPFNFDHLLASVQNVIANRAILKEHFTSDIGGNENVLRGIDKKFLNDLAGIVEKNLANDAFSVDDICKVVGISRVQLYRKVKALLGTSVIDYILHRRLKKAKYFLANEGYTIAEVTYLVGFANPNYFSTVFKAKYGVSPSQYRKDKGRQRGKSQDK